jgi:TRAP-type transport system periplasmic protein
MIRIAVAVLLLAGSARAERVLRIATIAPEGTAWARELRAFARDVSTQTAGRLGIKWVLGGIAGDDVQVNQRVQRGQLDGIGSGGMLCEKLSPTMRAVHLMTTTREEASWITNRLRPQIEEEFKGGGYYFIGTGGVGPDVIFSRQPVRTMDELRKTRLWVWDLDDVVRAQLPEIGATAVALPMDDARRAYEDSRTDGFVAVPAAALAYQWSAVTHHVTDLRLGFLTACVLLSSRAMDGLPNEDRDSLRAASAKLQLRFEDLSRQQDEQLLGKLFARQGLRTDAPSAAFRAEFDAATAAARSKLADKLAPRAIMDRVAALRDEFRRTHPKGAQK